MFWTGKTTVLCHRMSDHIVDHLSLFIQVNIGRQDCMEKLRFLHSALGPLLESYYVTACQISKQLHTEVPELDFTKMVHDAAKSRVQDGVASYGKAWWILIFIVMPPFREDGHIVNMVIFAGGKFAKMLPRLFTWGQFSRYFSDFLNKEIWALFSCGGNFCEEDNIAKNAKITPTRKFPRLQYCFPHVSQLVSMSGSHNLCNLSGENLTPTEFNLDTLIDTNVQTIPFTQQVSMSRGH